MRRLTFWEAVALLVGTQIGAGILGLPKIVADLGTFWGSAAILLAGLLTLLTAIFLLEALYQTNPRYHVYDLSRHYLGKWGVVLTAAILYSGYGALTAYIGGLAGVLESALGIPAVVGGVLFWAVFGAVVYMGLKFSGVTAEALNLFMLLLVVTIAAWTLPHSSAYLRPFDLSRFFAAFSVAVFAFFGHVVIPEIARECGNPYKSAAVVITAFSITTLVYLVFSLSIAGVTKEGTTDIATEGLIPVLGEYFAMIAYAFPALTISTSFIGVGLAQMDIIREVTRSRRVAWALALVPPLLFYVSGFRSFVETLFISSLGLLIAGGVLPPVLFLLSRRHRRPIYCIDTRLAYAVILFFIVVLLYSAHSALAGM